MRFAVELLPARGLSPRPVPALAGASGTASPDADAPLLAEWPNATAGDLVSVLADVCLSALESSTAGIEAERSRTFARSPAAAISSRQRCSTKEGSRERVH